MTPIISPWAFYLMPVCENVGIVVCLGGIFLAVLAIIFFVGYAVEATSPYCDEDANIKRMALAKKTALAAIILLLVCCFIPSEKTITKMILAQNVTYERVEAVGDTVETVYNDIMELFADEEETDG